MAVPSDVQEFAALLSAELEADGWGDIDPWIFKHLGEGVDTDDGVKEGSGEDCAGMARVLARALDRWKARQ